jgi:hypothetical protein
MSSTEVFNPETMPEEPIAKDPIQRFKDLVRFIVDEQMEIADVEAELVDFPRTALVEAASNGEAGYQLERIAGRGDLPEVQRLEIEKNIRLSFLSESERQQALSEASAWIDTNL